MSDSGGPAFPSVGAVTLRDYFASNALSAVIAAYVRFNGSCLGTDHILNNAPAIAFKFADAMIAERKKE